MMIRKASIIALLVLCLGTSPLFAGTTTAATWNGTQAVSSTFIQPIGWYFRPTVTMQVDQLGVYEDFSFSPGLEFSHNVGIYLVNGTAVVNALVPQGTVGTKIDGSRFISVPPVTLTGGVNYYIIGDGFQIGDDYLYGTGVVFAPQITWLGYAESDNGSFSRVTNYGGQPGNLGPNFRFTAVPEPSGLSLICLGLPALLRRRRQFRRRHESYLRGRGGFQR